MQLPQSLLYFVTSLPVLLDTVRAEKSTNLSWPHNLPPHIKYYPEHQDVMKMEDMISRRLQQQQPLTVKKMSADPGEKFYLHYWSFGTVDNYLKEAWNNMTTAKNFEPPVLLHARPSPPPPRNWRRYLGMANDPHNLFSKRDFVCPTGTNACTSINRPNACCSSGSTCQIVPDTGLGDVGCCNAAETCAGSLSTCPQDYTSCPNNPGGGCCLPGYACYQEGCVQTSTTVVVVTPTPTSTSLPPSTVTDTTTVVVTPSITISTTTSSLSSSSSSSVEVPPTTITTTDSVTISSSSTTSSLVCSTEFRSCPTSLGGGCCRTDRACGRNFCPELSSTASLEPPVRGTTSTDSITDPASPSTSLSACPTNFYACSAYHQGGCCQVDRDCHSTSCPARSGNTVLNSNSVTVVAPTGACAGGWSTCAANVGGGCCPSGYACGTASCTATASGQSTQVGKETPNSASCLVYKSALIRSLALGALSVLLLMSTTV